MSNSSVAMDLPNPHTPLAFLAPDIANQLEIYRYVAVATFGAFTWNIFTQLDVHHKLIFQNRITLATVAYFVSIISTAAYLCCCIAFHAGSSKNCQAMATVVASVYTVTFPSTSLLFLLRVRAIYAGHKVVTAFFVLCWLALLGLAITSPFSLHGAHIGPTTQCIDSGSKPITPAPVLASTTFDSLVFLFISWRLLNNTMAGDTFRDKIRTFFGKGGLPALSRALLYSGQVYYLITMCANIATTVLILSPSIPPHLHSLTTTPNSALTCMMACKVYRDIKFGVHQDSFSSRFSSSFVPARRHTTQVSSPLHISEPANVPTNVGFEKLTFNGAYPTGEMTIQPVTLATYASSETSSNHKVEV